ncbi:MAG: GTPase Obg, partial [Paracoccaceae bacterium]
NAGKSTFLAACSNARPKIADYPFTTLHPNLGVIAIDDTEFVMADIPGLIEGAHEGRGVGDRFLGHIERCAVLLHLIDATSDDALGDYRVIERELAAYGAALEAKPRIVVLNKCDALADGAADELITLLRGEGVPVSRAISGATGHGVKAVLRALRAEIDRARASERKALEETGPWTP